MKTLLWLDDYRNPYEDNRWLAKYAPEYAFTRDNVVVWVKSYDEFTKWITENGLPTKICFDHDLADEHYAPEEVWDNYNEWAAKQTFKEKTGYDCAHWLTEYCMDNNEQLPNFVSQSANPSGVININGLLLSFLKHYKFEDKKD